MSKRRPFHTLPIANSKTLEFWTNRPAWKWNTRIFGNRGKSVKGLRCWGSQILEGKGVCLMFTRTFALIEAGCFNISFRDCLESPEQYSDPAVAWSLSLPFCHSHTLSSLIVSSPVPLNANKAEFKVDHFKSPDDGAVSEVGAHLTLEKLDQVGP